MNKKAYIRPDVQLVDFSLSSSIAATCKNFAGFANENNCTYDYNGWKVFESKGICNLVIDNNGQFCYHVPTDDTRIFAS